MKVSQNLYAETLLKALGAAQKRARHHRRRTHGGAQNVLTEWGVKPDALRDVRRLRPVAIQLRDRRAPSPTCFEHMYNDPRHRDAFLATLPIAGKDGTIATRLRGTRAEGNAVAKTGSIANVRSLSGFVKTRDGEMLVFSILANDFIIPSATINRIADLGVETLAELHSAR